MKRAILILLALAMIIGTFGCSQGSGNSKEKQATQADNAATSEEKTADNGVKNIRIWIPPFGTEDTLDKAVWTEMVQPFVEKTGANIEIQVIGWDAYPDKYLAGVSSGNGPDLGYMYADMFPDFIEMGAVEDLAPYLTDELREKHLYLNEGFIMGKQYGLPIIIGNPRIMFYNKTILEKEGVQIPTKPLSWEEFIDACKKVTKDTDNDGKIDQWGTIMPWGDKTYGVLQATFTPYLLQAGGQLYADDGKTATFGSEAGIRAAQFIHDLIYKYGVMPKECTGMSEAETQEMFKEGKVAFMCAASSLALQFEGLNLDWGYIPALKDKEAATMMVADHLVLMSAARNKQLTFDLMVHVLSGENQAIFHKKLSPFPPVTKDEEYNDNPAFKDLYENYSNMLKTEKPVKGAFKMNDYLYKNLQLVMMDEVSPEEALKEAQDYANTILAE